MKLLLDTQSLLWFLLDDSRLSEAAKTAISTFENDILVSPASLWEIAIKISIGKYALPVSFPEFWNEQLKINQFTLLPISIPHTAKVAKMPFHHRDPFDRLIIAQAAVEDIAVISNDAAFDSYNVKRNWLNINL